jgi:hypothetical protein
LKIFVDDGWVDEGRDRRIGRWKRREENGGPKWGSRGSRERHVLMDVEDSGRERREEGRNRKGREVTRGSVGRGGMLNC